MVATVHKADGDDRMGVRCSWGRYPNGIPGSQSLVTCQNGLLSPADFRCSLGSCALPKVSHAADKCAEGAFVPDGQRCTPTCMDGFETEIYQNCSFLTLMSELRLSTPTASEPSRVIFDDYRLVELFYEQEEAGQWELEDAALRLAQVQVAEREVRSRRVNASERLRMALRACRGLLPDQPSSRGA
eukprot:s1397_g9.t1